MPQRPSDLIPDNPDFKSAARRAMQDVAAIVGGTATTKYMRTGGTNVGPNRQTGPGSLRRQTGRLARSLTGARSAQPTAGSMRGAPEGVFDLTPTRNGIRLTYGSKVEYAATHEYGDRRAVTTKQEAFFWAKHNETGKEKWRAMALSDTLTYPERPYLEPAFEDSLDEIVDVVEREAFRTLMDDDSS